MSRPRVLIVGSGLGGCMLARALCDTHEVLMVEREAATAPAVRDVGRPALTEPHHATGLGGSTRLWHHGLIEIDPEVFDNHWPFDHQALEPWYRQAFELLAGVSLESIRQQTEALRQAHHRLGVAVPAHPGLYYPTWPANAWQALRLEGRVVLIRGEVTALIPGGGNTVSGVQVQTAQGERRVEAPLVVLAGGGLGTPGLLQDLAAQGLCTGGQHLGHHYEDHPMGFVGELELEAPLYRLWNVRTAGRQGTLRLPIVLRREGLHLSFQLRPAVATAGSRRRERVDTALNRLRRQWWSPLAWIDVLRHPDDLLDILSFQFGLHLPTRHYTLLMVAQMNPGPHRAVWRDRATGDDRHRAESPAAICRDWRLSPQDLQAYAVGVREVLERLRPVTRSARLFERWPEGLRSAAHHSGTARLSSSPSTGVCDPQARVHGLQNLYVCDGSLIPASGVANTGLTIAALALRLAAHLKGPSTDATPRSPAEARA